jgi:hypothetical protein
MPEHHLVEVIGRQNTGLYDCIPQCPIRLMVRMLDSQSGDKGSIPLWDTTRCARSGDQMNERKQSDRAA